MPLKIEKMSILKTPKSIKYLFVIIIFVCIAYISINFHIYSNENNAAFDKLYEGLKNVEQKDKSFLAFINSGEKSTNYLLKELTQEKDDLTKSDIIQIIGFTGCNNCAVKLIPFLNDPNWRIRFYTIDTLHKLKYDKILFLLPSIILNDSNQKVKIKAIITIGDYDKANNVNFLEKLAGQKEYQDENLKKAIVMAISKLRSNSTQN